MMRRTFLLLVCFLGALNPASAFTPREFVIYFNRGAALTNEGKVVADEFASYVRSTKPTEVVIQGHDDTATSAERSLAMSVRRAEVVRKRLIRAGVSPKLIRIEARGETTPAVPTGDGVPEILNRRVVLQPVWPN